MMQIHVKNPNLNQCYKIYIHAPKRRFILEYYFIFKTEHRRDNFLKNKFMKDFRELMKNN